MIYLQSFSTSFFKRGHEIKGFTKPPTEQPVKSSSSKLVQPERPINVVSKEVQWAKLSLTKEVHCLSQSNEPVSSVELRQSKTLKFERVCSGSKVPEKCVRPSSKVRRF